MKVELLAMPEKKAQEEYDAIRQLLKQDQKRKKDLIYRDFQSVLAHLRHGKKIVDVYESFKRAGLNEDGDPKLAICRADAKQCYCQKYLEGSALFSLDSKVDYWDRPRKTLNDILLPHGTFPWHKKDPNTPMYRWNIKNEKIKTLVPIIPAKILITEVKALLKNFHIIWEVEKWEPIPPKDPILVKQLTPNLFGVLATWNLTELERAIIRGRIQ